jgi:hypothetical protein
LNWKQPLILIDISVIYFNQNSTLVVDAKEATEIESNGQKERYKKVFLGFLVASKTSNFFSITGKNYIRLSFGNSLVLVLNYYEKKCE